MKKAPSQQIATSQRPEEPPIQFDTPIDIQPLISLESLPCETDNRKTASSREGSISTSSYTICNDLARVLPITDGYGNFDSFAPLTVFATMLYPRDDGARDEYLASWKAEILAPLEWEKPEDRARVDRVYQLLRQALGPHGGFATLSRAPRHAEIRRGETALIREGFLAGLILVTLVRLAAMAPPASINKAIHIVEYWLNIDDGPPTRRGPWRERNIRKIWSQYRLVVHLWAAEIYDVMQSEYTLCERPSVSSLSCISLEKYTLLEFFARSALFLAFGTQHRPHRGTPTPPLDCKDMWNIPSDCPLPAIRLHIPPLTAWEKEGLAAE